MTILSRSTIQPDLLTVQCDVCFPQHISTTTLEVLTERGWLLRENGEGIDMCHHCRFEPHQGHTPRVERAAGATSSGHLPNFMVIGAAKAGTTSLHYYLDQHPDLFMAELKELRYFCDPDCASWEALYRDEFPTNATVRGEATTLYTRSPAIPGVAARMAATLPDARLVYLVRDPVARALASWREERFHVTDQRSAEEAFAHPEDPHNPYVAASMYAAQLEEFRQVYPAEQILVIDQRDLAEDPAATLSRIVEFVGLSPFAFDTGVNHNEGTTKFEYVGLGHRLRHSAPARLARRLPAPAREALISPARALFRKPVPKPDLSEDLLDRMRAVLAPDAARLREMTGLDLSHWSV